MIVYRINNGKIGKTSREAIDYVLQPNEYGSTIWYKKPFFNGVTVVESITQQEIDDQTETDIENTLTTKLNKHKTDGEAFFKKLGNFIRRRRENGILVDNATAQELIDMDDSIKQNTITQAQYKSIRITLQPALQPLRYGDWDIAQDNIDAITPPSNSKMLAIYNFIKNKVDTYVAANNF